MGSEESGVSEAEQVTKFSPEGGSRQEATQNSGEQVLSPEQQERQGKINDAKIALESVLQPSPGSLMRKSEYDAWLARVNTLAQEYTGLTGVTLDEKLDQLRAGEQAQLWKKQVDAYTEMGKNGVLSTPPIAEGFSVASQGYGRWQSEKESLDALEQSKIEQAVKGVAAAPTANV